MSDDNKTVNVADSKAGKAAPPADKFELTLDEFCRQQSAQKVGPELIAGFHHSQVAAGRVKALASVFDTAFVRFANQPA